MTEDNLKTKVYHILSGITPNLTQSSGNDTRPLYQLIDSLDMMNFLESLESQFDIEITDEEAATLEHIDAVVAFLKSKTGQ
jgi:acyl carrier protein